MLCTPLALLLAFAPAPYPTAEGPEAPGPPVELEFGARVLLRPEARANPSFGAVAHDEAWRVLQSARLMGAARYGPLAAVVQLQDVRQWGAETTSLSVEPFTGAHQAYAEVGRARQDSPRRVGGFLRVGRQEVVLWSGRLLGNAPWQPGMRAFDAARGRVEYGKFGFEAGAAVLRMARTLTLTDDTSTTTLKSNGDQLAWAEATALVHPAFEAHAAVIVLQEDATETDLGRDRRLTTPGAYVHGEPVEGLTYDVEAYGQIGRDGERSHRAWAGAAVVGYAFDAPSRPGLRLAYEIASGGSCPESPETSPSCDQQTVRDFDQLLGTRHPFRGFADLFGLTNVRDLHTRASLAPDSTVRLWIDYHWLQLQDPKGRWIDTSGAPVGRGWDPTNDRNTMGHEIDLLATYVPWKPLTIRPGYSVFIPTAGGRDIAGDRALHFVYLWVILELRGRWTPGSS